MNSYTKHGGNFKPTAPPAFQHLKIFRVITADDPFHEPWPPGNGFVMGAEPVVSQHGDGLRRRSPTRRQRTRILRAAVVGRSMSDLNQSLIPARGADPGGCKAAAHEALVAPQCCAEGTASQRGGRRSRAKGNRMEREIINEHHALGVHTKRHPFSGASRFRAAVAKVCQP
jgi:hypothetical protein